MIKKIIYTGLILMLLCGPAQAKTLDDLQDFLEKDPTNLKEYDINKHCCRHFAKELYINATKAGFKCSKVELSKHVPEGYRLSDFWEQRFSTHEINYFWLDSGSYFVEPQTDSIYNLDAISCAYIKYDYAKIENIRKTVMDPNPQTVFDFVNSSDNLFFIKGEGKETI